MVNIITSLFGYFSDTFVCDTGDTFVCDTPGTFVSDIGGTFEVILSQFGYIMRNRLSQRNCRKVERAVERGFTLFFISFG